MAKVATISSQHYLPYADKSIYISCHGVSRSPSQLSWGREVVHSCGLIDLGFEGYPYTWSNGRMEEANIQCRLDRALASRNFVDMFSPVRVIHLPRFGSDHAAIRIDLDVLPEELNSSHEFIFRFEEAWTKDPTCETAIRRCWDTGGNNGIHKIKSLQSLGETFKEYRSGAVKKELNRIEGRLKEASNWDSGEHDVRTYKALEKQRDSIQKTEEIIWRQRSRAVWLQAGDKNTKFFHGKASQRRKTNRIQKLQDHRGVWWRGEKHCERILKEYFSDIFKSSQPENIETICDIVRGKLKADQVDYCATRFTAEEVELALSQMHPLKAPGPDGLPSLFFQKYWHVVGEDVKHLVLGVLNDSQGVEDINRTFIALIPKVKNPASPKEFRPISLCNVVMKLVTKTIANRVKQVLPDIVDEEQSAFVKGRLITNNALIALECFHWMKKKRKGKKGAMAVKLDMAKAYDRMEWGFVVGILRSMGFPSNLVNLISNCITTVTYQVLINGKASGVICMLKKEAREAQIHGIQVARKAPVITHLLFADDSLLFARALCTEAAKIMDILKRYESSSGQMVNLDKSEVSFSRNVPEADKQMIRNRMGVKTVEAHSRYLGLPALFGRSKKLVFSQVINRVWKKVKGWKEKTMSRAGKEVLIKAVAQAIPTYVMGCFKLPEDCCKEIESLLARFWWGSSADDNKIHWLSWAKMTKAKGAGGMGFRGIGDFNVSLLGKQFWRLQMGNSSLLERVFKSRYYPRTPIGEAKLGYAPSYAWRSIFGAKELIDMGSRWRIGAGDQVNILRDNWIPGAAAAKVLGPVQGISAEATVSYLIDEDLRCWKHDLIKECFSPMVCEEILSIPLSWRNMEDKLIWYPEKDGEFSVKSAYHLLRSKRDAAFPGPSSHSQNLVWKRIWQAPVHNRVRNFLWRTAKDILPTRANLHKRKVNLAPDCPLCHSHVESSNHLFLHCNVSKQVWFLSPLGLRIPPSSDLIFWLDKMLNSGDPYVSQLFSVILWKIWFYRNRVIFKKEDFVPHKVVHEAMDWIQEYNVSNPPKGVHRLAAVGDENGNTKPGFTSVYVDAGCFEDGTVAMGCVMKGTDKGVFFSATKKQSMNVDPSMAEALALRWALKMAVEFSIKQAVFFSDALSVVDCINRISFSAVMDPIIGDCLDLLNCFSSAICVYVSRVYNTDAHNLVSIGHRLGSRTWLGLPSSVSPVVFFPSQ
ncbi:uncharacterized protein LOC131637556 [Vicia villosa]|uniref:uncharacterized protein LOC131637556 n=1 Tax=Vicia villosa TaxID=3911 RepID=UPI00273CDCB9|nr:uncharacterized protein LOC131637556 [Vicia villosa]